MTLTAAIPVVNPFRICYAYNPYLLTVVSERSSPGDAEIAIGPVPAADDTLRHATVFGVHQVSVPAGHVRTSFGAIFKGRFRGPVDPRAFIPTRLGFSRIGVERFFERAFNASAIKCTTAPHVRVTRNTEIDYCNINYFERFCLSYFE